jgi:acyl carrier protein
MKENILAELQQIFRKVFKDPDLVISYTTGMDDRDDWDSLTHAILIDAIEKHFTIKFSLHDLLTLSDVNSICNSIVSKMEK